MRMRVPRRSLIPALVVAAAAILTAQRAESPVFRTGITVVNIDAIVTDDTGAPVLGLRADDFEVREVGKVRPIAAFAAIDLQDPPLPPFEAAGVESDVSTNTTSVSRQYVFALSEVGPDKALRTRHLLRQFLDQYFGPHDVAAVVLTCRGLADSGQDFTGNRRLLLNAIDRFTGGFSESSEACLQADPSGGRQLASSLRRLTESLARLPGRKVLVFVAENTEKLDFNFAEGYRGGALTPAEGDAHAALAAATRGNVTIYPVDPCGLSPGHGEAELNRQMDLKRLGALTGGFATTNSNSFSQAFERIVEENSHYYTLGFESDQNREDGRFIRVDVRVKRPGLRVQARSGYLAPIGRVRAPEAVEADAKLAAVAEALTSPVPVHDVTLQVFAAPYRAAGGQTRVTLAIEVGGDALSDSARGAREANPFEVSYLATDSRGKVHPGRRHTLTMTRTSNAMASKGTPTVRVLSEVALPPGRFQLRVAAGTRDQAGSVLVDLEVPDYKETALALSGLFLTTDAAAAIPTLRPVEILPGAPGPPIARRDFDRKETLGLMIEAYTPTNSENAPDIHVTTTLRAEDGQVTSLPLDARTLAMVRIPQGYRITGRCRWHGSRQVLMWWS